MSSPLHESAAGRGEILEGRATARLSRKSSFQTSFSQNNIDLSDLSVEERNQKILERRGVFKWMHVAYSNDLVYGSWYFVYGSLLCVFIPIVPLIAIYEDLWHSNDEEEELGIPDVDSTACYSLLIFIGILYTIGSYAFLRAVETPKVPPLFPNFRHFQSDELFGMWCFFLGTLPSVPLMCIYVYYNRESQSFWLALLVCVVFTVLSFIAVLACYPEDKERPSLQQKMSWIFVMCPCIRQQEYISPLCCCCPKFLRKHIATDWLIVSWGLFLGCVFSDFVCLGLLLYSLEHKDGRGVFDYGTGLFDMILFTIGSMYFLAGSYPDPLSDCEVNEVKTPFGSYV